MKLSKRAVATTPSVTVELNARVLELKNSGVDIIKFNIGEPDFNTPRPICDAAKLAMDQGQTKYTAVPGTAALRQAIAGKLERDNHVWYNSSEICVTTGAKQALFETVMALAEEGDEVIIPTPCWVSYESMVAIAGAKAVLVPTVEAGENQFDLDIPAIERAITPNTRAIIINTPNNPTGVVYGEALLRELADLAIRHGILIISDEVYEKLLYNDKCHFSIASISEEAKQHAVTVNGYSKTYAMTGWRLGYLAGPKELIKAVSRLQGHITGGTCSISQAAGLAADTGDDDSVEQMRQIFDRRRQQMLSICRELLGVSCREPDGAFYLMPDFSSYYGKRAGERLIQNSVDLAGYLLEEAHVAVVPGDGFRAPNCLRLSYSTSEACIEKGMGQIRAALEKLQ